MDAGSHRRVHVWPRSATCPLNSSRLYHWLVDMPSQNAAGSRHLQSPPDAHHSLDVPGPRLAVRGGGDVSRRRPQRTAPLPRPVLCWQARHARLAPADADRRGQPRMSGNRRVAYSYSSDASSAPMDASRMSTSSSICSRVMISGGARSIMSPACPSTLPVQG